MPLGERDPVQELGPAFQLGAEGLGEFPHADGVGGDEVCADVRELGAGLEPVSALAAGPVEEDQPEPVGPGGRGEGGGH